MHQYLVVELVREGGKGSHLEGVDSIIHRPLKIVQQLLGGSSQNHCADLPLLLWLFQHDDCAAADVLAAEALGIADLVCSRCSQLHLGCRACRPAHQTKHAGAGDSGAVEETFRGHFGDVLRRGRM